MPDVDELGLIMTTGSLRLTEQTMAMKEVLAANDVRTLVANYLGVSIGRVTDGSHFTNDLGVDWLGRLELMMAVEDQFAAWKSQMTMSIGWRLSAI